MIGNVLEKTHQPMVKERWKEGGKERRGVTRGGKCPTEIKERKSKRKNLEIIMRKVWVWVEDTCVKYTVTVVSWRNFTCLLELRVISLDFMGSSDSYSNKFLFWFKKNACNIFFFCEFNFEEHKVTESQNGGIAFYIPSLSINCYTKEQWAADRKPWYKYIFLTKEQWAAERNLWCKYIFFIAPFPTKLRS